MTTDFADLESCARRVRTHVLRMAHASQAPHVASALSCVDLLVALYWSVLRLDPHKPDAPDRDRFILSKGHACSAQYAALAERGFFDVSLLDEYARDGGRLPEHPSPHGVPGIEAATGSLGHGLSVGAGLALAAKLLGADYRVYVTLSDAECYEGSVWEAALFAHAQSLSSLSAIVDLNGWSAMTRTSPLNPLADKWRAFGWSVIEIDGHDFRQILPALSPRSVGGAEPGPPHIVIAHTVKGKGVSFMENNLEWHYRPPNAGDLSHALREISA